MIKYKLQFFGGRGSAGGNATPAKQTANIGSLRDIDRVSFTKRGTGVYSARVGNMESSYSNGSSSPAAEMIVAPHREDGRTFYTTRYIVYGGNRDWQYNTHEYSSLNAAKAGVRESLKDYLDELRRR